MFNWQNNHPLVSECYKKLISNYDHRIKRLNNMCLDGIGSKSNLEFIKQELEILKNEKTNLYTLLKLFKGDVLSLFEPDSLIMSIEHAVMINEDRPFTIKEQLSKFLSTY